MVNERPDLRLRFVNPVHARVHGDARVTEVAVLPLARATVNPGHPPVPEAVALITLNSDINHAAAAALVDILRYLKERRATALVLQTPGRELRVPDSVRTLAESLRLPLLMSTADTEWAGVNAHLQQRRAASAERHVEQLDGLLNRLPSRLANPDATAGIVSWLAAALNADVVVSSAERGVFAAAPEGLANLARALVGRTAEGDEAADGDETAEGDEAPEGHEAAEGDETAEGDAAEHSRLVQIHGAEDGAVLAAASHRPFDVAAGNLIRHAAKLLGLCEQARRDHQAAVLAPRSVSQAATQLFLGGNIVTGQVVANTIAPELMDTETTRVRVIDTGPQDREPTLRWCERTLHGRALVSPCPGKARQIIVITPSHQETGVASDLHRMISTRDWLLMGESLPYALVASGAGYAEAAQAVRHAARSPRRISVGAEPKVASLLPRNAARAWAQALLAPVLAPEYRPILETLPTGLSFKPSEAARGLGIHRNTLRQRLAKAGSLLRLDLNTINDRILILLALDILSLPKAPETAPLSKAPETAPLPDALETAHWSNAPETAHLPDAPDTSQRAGAPDFAHLLQAEPGTVREWAEQRLREVRSDPRDLLTTLTVWLEHNLSVRQTAQALRLSDATVRHHTADASAMLGIDATTTAISVHDTDVVTIADIGIAAYLLTGRPALNQPRAERPAATEDSRTAPS
ncbi:helix-turn-helix domain-containing protein [Streptomyces cavernae]|uniref:helix-turn-helix domain-containing protein n=1 Tax=Streptomyces cavernae TaxID=2259034 RepID=UPI001EE45BE9|nr:helix-turn-helix domain-containing protein [Streptomyces cavernae]